MSIGNLAEYVEAYPSEEPDFDDPSFRRGYTAVMASTYCRDYVDCVRESLQRFIAEQRAAERRCSAKRDAFLKETSIEKPYSAVDIGAASYGGMAMSFGSTARDLERLLDRLCPLDEAAVSEEGVPF